MIFIIFSKILHNYNNKIGIFHFILVHTGDAIFGKTLENIGIHTFVRIVQKFFILFNKV